MKKRAEVQNISLSLPPGGLVFFPLPHPPSLLPPFYEQGFNIFEFYTEECANTLEVFHPDSN